MKKLGLGFAILTAFVLLPLVGFCQSNPPANGGEESNASATTTVAGIVRTVQDVPVPGAAVRVVHLASGRSWASWTDEEGKFSFPSLPAGRYRLEAKQLGFGASQLEVYFAEGATTEAQLMLHVDVSSAAAAGVKPETGAQPAPVSESTAPENVKSAKPAEESTSAVTKNGNQHQAAENPASGPAAGKPSAKASSSQKSHHKGFQQLETKGRPTPAEANTTSPSESAQGGSNNSKGTAQQQPLSAASAAPDDASTPLGDAASSDAFLMSGTVNRATALGGPGSFGAGGAPTGAGNFDTSAAAASGEFPLPGQGGDSTGTGKASGKGHKSQPGQHRKAKQAQAPTEANSFGQGIEELWAQHRLSRLSSNRMRFSFYNRYDNSAWDARPYSLTEPNPPKISHHEGKFGTHIGGPVYIPHVYDGRQRTFFFVSYELARATQPLDYFATVPTEPERGGDFTDRGAMGTPGAVQLFDPASSLTGPRTSFGSKIPQNRLDNAAVKMLQFIPKPNLPGFVQNFHLQTALPTNSDLGNIRILHTISPKLNLAASYQANSIRADNPYTLPQLTNNFTSLGQAVTLGLTQNWTSRLINESKINWSRYASDILNPFAFKQNIVGDLGITGVSQAPIDWGVPSTRFTNITSLSDTVPAFHRNQTLRVMDNLAYTLSKHTIRTGAEIRWMQLNTQTDPAPRGDFSFTGLMTSQLDTTGKPVRGTGFDFADFLLGLPVATTARFGNSKTYFREHEYIAYVQDDWRVHPRFAVNLGVRYELATPPVELFNSIADLVLNPNITAVALVCASPSSSPSCAPGRVNPFTGKALPSALMYTNTNNWSPRIGIAWRPPTKLPLVFRAGYGIFYNESIYNQLALSMANQFPFAQTQKLQTTTQKVLTLENGFPQQPSTNFTNTDAVDPNYKVGYAQLWNASLETQLSPSLVVEVTYTGTKGTHLDMLRAPNRSVPGSPYSTDLNRRIPNAPGFFYDTFGASSIYHSAQLLVARRMAHGLMIQGVYTFGRSIDNASSIGGSQQVVIQNDNNFAADRGLSSFDVRQQFRGTFSYELPFGQTKHWLHSGWASSVFGDLQASGLTTISTGMPFTALLGGSASDNTGTGSNFSTRADQIANANLPSDQRTPLHFFNTAAFTTPAPLQFGNAGRNTITGPGTFLVNFALTKKFRFGQDGRIHLDTRWEVQNLANTPNFVGLETHMNSSLFGRVQSVKPMRTMDLMLRVSF